MKLLHQDQICSPNFYKFCDYIWSSSPDYEFYYAQYKLSKYPHLQLMNKDIQPINGKGIIFMSQCNDIEHAFKVMPKTGSYILIHRDIDRSFTQEMYKHKPDSIKHIYTINCAVNLPDVTALPIGTTTVSTESTELKRIAEIEIPRAQTKVFCRFNTNKETHERNKFIEENQDKEFIKIVTNQIGVDKFYEEIKSHPYTMSLQGGGRDCIRTYEAITLGSTPIVSDCIEMRHFEDLPILFYNGNLTEQWLDSQSLKTKTANRIRMSYWEYNILSRKRDL